MTGVKRHISKRRSLLCAVAISLLAIAPSAPAIAGDVFVTAGGIAGRVPVTPISDRKFETVVRQQYDFSCGSAAVATLLTHHYEIPTTETAAFKAMWDVGDHERIRELGFSLLEMKNYLESLNLKADGFRLTLDRIQEIAVPGIALIDVKGYRHFVVIKGITDKRVLVGDPSKGVMTISRKRFEKHWDGVILFIRSDVVRGKKGFNRIADWRLAPGSPYDRVEDVASHQSLQSLTLNQTRPSFSGFTIGTVVENP